MGMKVTQFQSFRHFANASIVIILSSFVFFGVVMKRRETFLCSNLASSVSL